jgi:hypothetical protein
MNASLREEIKSGRAGMRSTVRAIEEEAAIHSLRACCKEMMAPPRNDGGTPGMQEANFREHGTRNRTSREDGCLDSGHEGWAKREDGLPTSDRGQSRENGAESRMMQSITEIGKPIWKRPQ